MRYLALLKAAQPSTPPPAELMEAIAKLGEEATRAGVLLDTAGLAPSASGARVQLSGGRLSVTDGPFTEAKELISYALYQARSPPTGRSRTAMANELGQTSRTPVVTTTAAGRPSAAPGGRSATRSWSSSPDSSRICRSAAQRRR
jgi:hypothetical protein